MVEWAAYEEIAGPILVHDRIDFGLAHIAYRIAQSVSRRRVKFEKFLPPWVDTRRWTDPAQLEAFLKGLADGNS